jgi:hypothetical protein
MHYFYVRISFVILFSAVLEKLLYGTLAFGALFTFTEPFSRLLGDVAGRFWGWDPKENGAARDSLEYDCVSSALAVDFSRVCDFWGDGLILML